MLLVVLVTSQVAQLAVTESCSLISEVFVCVPKTTAWFDSVIRKARTPIHGVFFFIFYTFGNRQVFERTQSPLELSAVYRHGANGTAFTWTLNLNKHPHCQATV